MYNQYRRIWYQTDPSIPKGALLFVSMCFLLSKRRFCLIRSEAHWVEHSWHLYNLVNGCKWMVKLWVGKRERERNCHLSKGPKVCKALLFQGKAIHISHFLSFMSLLGRYLQMDCTFACTASVKMLAVSCEKLMASASLGPPTR